MDDISYINSLSCLNIAPVSGRKEGEYDNIISYYDMDSCRLCGSRTLPRAAADLIKEKLALPSSSTDHLHHDLKLGQLVLES